MDATSQQSFRDVKIKIVTVLLHTRKRTSPSCEHRNPHTHHHRRKLIKILQNIQYYMI